MTEILHRRGHCFRADVLVQDGDERDLAAPLLRPPGADVVDDQAAHRSRRVLQEPEAIRKGHPAAPVEIEVGFVQQRRRAHRELAAAALKMRLGKGVQLAVQGCEQGIPGRVITRIGALN